MIITQQIKTVATPGYRKAQLKQIKNHAIFVKSYYGKRFLKILGAKGG